MATLPDIDAAIYTLLQNNSGITTQVGTEVWNLQAPTGTSFPYITFEVVTEGIDNIVPRDMMNITARVHSWGSTRATAAAAHLAVYTAVHEQALTISGWKNWWMVCEQGQRLKEDVEGVQIYHMVWDVRIRASIN